MPGSGNRAVDVGDGALWVFMTNSLWLGCGAVCGGVIMKRESFSWQMSLYF